jgi:hypothetical protein
MNWGGGNKGLKKTVVEELTDLCTFYILQNYQTSNWCMYGTCITGTGTRATGGSHLNLFIKKKKRMNRIDTPT